MKLDKRCLHEVEVINIGKQCRSEASGGEQEAKQGNSEWVCGSKQGVEEGAEHREEGRVLALHTLQLGGLSLCGSGL